MGPNVRRVDVTGTQHGRLGSFEHGVIGTIASTDEIFVVQQQSRRPHGTYGATREPGCLRR